MRGFPFGRAEEHLRHVPMVAALGLRFLALGPGRASMAMPPVAATRGTADGPPHAGAVVALLDHLSSCAVFAALDRYRPTATLDLRLDFMAPPDVPGEITAGAECLALDGDVAHVRAEARQADGRLVALSTAVFMIGNFPGTSAAEDDLAQPGGPAALPPADMLFPALCRIEDDADGYRLQPCRHLIGATPLPALHGGAIGALLLEAATRAGRGRRLRSLSIHYLRPAPAGPLLAAVRTERDGRRAASLALAALERAGGPALALGRASLAD
ncbi:PaaI family thioesterase [Zavarzinia compransoris]|nr:PaaI family thioesterase [Zavarzinia compransoris]TDP47252.1 uncharacterized protein (TIGR00369 family) [Zavarzinia compransoris]